METLGDACKERQSIPACRRRYTLAVRRPAATGSSHHVRREANTKNFIDVVNAVADPFKPTEAFLGIE
jgi:uncharacterized phage protein gp47/JayE